MARYLLVSVEDKPGDGARLAEALGYAGVNIEGICVVTQEGRGIVHVLMQDVAGARAALEGAGIKVEGETDVIVVDLEPANIDTHRTMGKSLRAIANGASTCRLLKWRRRIVS